MLFFNPPYPTICIRKREVIILITSLDVFYSFLILPAIMQTDKQTADKFTLLFLQRGFLCDRYLLFVTGEYLLKLTLILLLCK